MVSFHLAAVLAVAGLCQASLRSDTTTSRRLSYELIAGYEPENLVTDHNAIDLDLAEILEFLSVGTEEAWETAYKIYSQGAHSKSVARVKLGSGLTSPLDEGAQVVGFSAGERINEVHGMLFKAYPQGTRDIQIQYETISIQDRYVGCQVGGSPNPVTERCFATSSELIIAGLTSPVNYTYNALQDNENARTLMGFSMDARYFMWECENCPYSEYEKFFNYYNVYDYGHQWVKAAFTSGNTPFSNGVGNANFASYEKPALSEAIEKGVVLLNVFMYVIRELETALDECKEGCGPPAAACVSYSWDKAVAFYTGSLEGQDGSGTGVFLHATADKKCVEFATCGSTPSESSTTGTSYVNKEIFRQFHDGQRKLSTGNCMAARENKQRIVELMRVPLIQGTLRYAYFQSRELQPDQKAELEGATYAASVLPFVYNCSKDDAAVIYEYMRVGHEETTDFGAVKEAFERNYDCLGVSCEEIGGLHDIVTKDYFPDAKPCGGGKRVKKRDREDRDGPDAGRAIGLAAAGIVLMVIIVFVSSCFGPKAAAPPQTERKADAEVS